MSIAKNVGAAPANNSKSSPDVLTADKEAQLLHDALNMPELLLHPSPLMVRRGGSRTIRGDGCIRDASDGSVKKPISTNGVGPSPWASGTGNKTPNKPSVTAGLRSGGLVRGSSGALKASLKEVVTPTLEPPLVTNPADTRTKSPYFISYQRRVWGENPQRTGVEMTTSKPQTPHKGIVAVLGAGGTTTRPTSATNRRPFQPAPRTAAGFGRRVLNAVNFDKTAGLVTSVRGGVRGEQPSSLRLPSNERGGSSVSEKLAMPRGVDVGGVASTLKGSPTSRNPSAAAREAAAQAAKSDSPQSEKEAVEKYRKAKASSPTTLFTSYGVKSVVGEDAFAGGARTDDRFEPLSSDFSGGRGKRLERPRSAGRRVSSSPKSLKQETVSSAQRKKSSSRPRANGREDMVHQQTSGLQRMSDRPRVEKHSNSPRSGSSASPKAPGSHPTTPAFLKDTPKTPQEKSAKATNSPGGTRRTPAPVVPGPYTYNGGGTTGITGALKAKAKPKTVAKHSCKSAVSPGSSKTGSKSSSGSKSASPVEATSSRSETYHKVLVGSGKPSKKSVDPKKKKTGAGATGEKAAKRREVKNFWTYVLEYLDLSSLLVYANGKYSPPQVRLKNLGEMQDIVAELRATLAKQSTLYKRATNRASPLDAGSSLGALPGRRLGGSPM